MSKIRIIYLTGSGRSGSTLLNAVMGNLPLVMATGEIQNFGRSILNEEYCSCGKLADSCELWSKVISFIEEQEPGFNLEHFYQLHQKYANFKSLKAWWRVKLAQLRKPKEEHLIYLRYLEKMYQGILKESGKEVIFDASKNPLFGANLALSESVDVRYIHFIRHPVAVYYSLSKAYKVDASAGLQKEIKPKSPFRAALFWNVVNLMAEYTLRSIPAEKKIRMNYENFLVDPSKELSRISKLANINTGILTEMIASDSPFQMPEHVIAGNRLRMKKTIKLKLDDAWKTQVEPGKKRMVTFLSSINLKRYGY